jgi:hypothetical protein
MREVISDGGPDVVLERYQKRTSALRQEIFCGWRRPPAILMNGTPHA